MGIHKSYVLFRRLGLNSQGLKINLMHVVHVFSTKKPVYRNDASFFEHCMTITGRFLSRLPNTLLPITNWHLLVLCRSFYVHLLCVY